MRKEVHVEKRCWNTEGLLCIQESGNLRAGCKEVRGPMFICLGDNGAQYSVMVAVGCEEVHCFFKCVSGSQARGKVQSEAWGDSGQELCSEAGRQQL